MSFWSDSSPIVKGAVIVGVIGVLVSLLAWFELPPFDPYEGEDVGNERGLPSE
jgi:hypothetical protein